MNDQKKLEKLKKLSNGFLEGLNELAYEEVMIEKLSKLSDIQEKMDEVFIED